MVKQFFKKYNEPLGFFEYAITIIQVQNSLDVIFGKSGLFQPNRSETYTF